MVQGKLTIEQRDDTSIYALSGNKDELASLELNDWETRFFNKKIGKLIFDFEALSAFAYKETEHIIDSLLSFNIFIND